MCVRSMSAGCVSSVAATAAATPAAKLVGALGAPACTRTPSTTRFVAGDREQLRPEVWLHRIVTHYKLLHGFTAVNKYNGVLQSGSEVINRTMKISAKMSSGLHSIS